jgi:hypothetical protein
MLSDLSVAPRFLQRGINDSRVKRNGATTAIKAGPARHTEVVEPKKAVAITAFFFGLKSSQ